MPVQTNGMARNDEREKPLSAAVAVVVADHVKGRTPEHECFGAAALAVLSACFGPLLFGLTTGFTSPAIGTMLNPGAPSNLHIFDSTGEAAFFASCVNIAAIPGALLAGPLADTIGRRRTLQICAPALFASYGLLAIARQNAVLYAARLLAGLGVGVCTVVVPMYIGEVSPTRKRGFFGALNQFSFSLGVLLVYAGGSCFREGAACQWRHLAAAIAIPSALLGVCMSFVPESPDYFLRMEDFPRAQQASQRLRLLSKKILVEERRKASLGISPSSSSGSLVSLSSPGSSSRRSLACAKENPRPVGMAITVMLLKAFSGDNVVVYYLDSILYRAGISWASQAGAMIMCVMVLMTGLSTSLVEVAGRKSLLFVSFLGMSLSAGLLAVSFTVNVSPWVSVVAATGYVCFYGIGVGPVPWILMAEILPADARGLVCSIATCSNWAGAFLVTWSFAPLQAAIGINGLFWTYCCILLASAVYIAIFVIETKGKSVEEVVAILTPPVLTPVVQEDPDEDVTMVWQRPGEEAAVMPAVVSPLKRPLLDP